MTAIPQRRSSPVLVELSLVGCLAISSIIGRQAYANPPQTEKAQAIARVPQRPIELFATDDLSPFTTWLKKTRHSDPKKIFSLKNGVLRITGEDAGYLATRQAYRDYQLRFEYKWGTRTDGSKYVRNSGILLHGTGADGSRAGVWMTSIECQLAQGCEGDLIVIRGKDSQGKIIPATITSDTRLAPDNKTRWIAGGKKTVYSGRQFWWSRHQVGFKELRDTRGTEDVASPLGQWTRVKCICRGDRIAIYINGVQVNECYDVVPSSGRILFQNESNEIFFRRAVLQPLP